MLSIYLFIYLLYYPFIYLFFINLPDTGLLADILELLNVDVTNRPVVPKETVQALLLYIFF